MTWTRGVIRDHEWPTPLVPILQSLDVEAVNVQFATRPRSFQGGQLNEEAQTLTGPAREEHRQRGYGFWDEVLAHVDRVSAPTRASILGRAVRHDVGVESLEPMTLADFEGRCRAGAFTALPARHMASLTSSVTTPRGERHLPMLDLQTTNLDLAISVADALDLPGLLVSSGNSFHLYGQELLTPAELTPLLGRAQLLSPLTDHRWAAHQIINGYAALRISTDTERNSEPGVVRARWV